MRVGTKVHRGRKRNIVICDPLWAEVQRECARRTIATGEPMSASEWIRLTVRAELDRTERARAFAERFTSDS